MNIRRYITAHLLLFGCIISMSAAAVPDVRSVVRQDAAVVESTDYYPYGTPFTTANSVQPYKYGTKELDRMHGLDLYDSEARWYDSLLGRTSTMDPKSEKYYGLSPYLWCAGNPVKYGDERGDTIAVFGFQQKSWRHIALLIQDENNKWRYYSVNGDNVYFPGCLFSSSTKNNSINQLGSFIGGKETDDLGETSYNSICDFLNSESNESDYAYDIAYEIDTTKHQDMIISKAFKKISDTPYDILSNNCATAVAKSLNKAGIITYMGNNNPIWTIKLNSYIPSRLFNDIVKHNSNGSYIYK